MEEQIEKMKYKLRKDARKNQEWTNNDLTFKP